MPSRQLQDGSIALAIPAQAQVQRDTQAVDQAITIIQRRIDGSGVLNPIIQRQGQNQIVVQLPGISDPERVKTLIGTTAHMTFQMVDSTAVPGQPAPLGDEWLPMSDNPQQQLAVQTDVAVDGADLQNAQASTDPQSGQWVVNFTLNAVGAREFADTTTANVGKLFAIVLDGKIIEAPVIREPITGGSGQISGNFTPQSATDLALLLRAGALPAPLNIVEEQSVGPELGADAIRAGAISLAVGFVLVLFFMALFYGLFGWFANIALVANLVLMLAILSVMGATLTLPGMAGILLTLGMAVDANILINERVREEVKNGRKPLAALGSRLQARLRHHHRFQRDHAAGARHAVHLRLAPGARLRRDDLRRHHHHHVHRHGAGASHHLALVRRAPPCLPARLGPAPCSPNRLSASSRTEQKSAS